MVNGRCPAMNFICFVHSIRSDLNEFNHRSITLWNASAKLQSNDAGYEFIAAKFEPNSNDDNPSNTRKPIQRVRFYAIKLQVNTHLPRTVNSQIDKCQKYTISVLHMYHIIEWKFKFSFRFYLQQSKHNICARSIN